MTSARVDQLLIRIRDQCLVKGCSGIRGLGVLFRQLDLDFSKKITLHELRKGLKEYGLVVDDADLVLVFSALDRDRSGEIDFAEFMQQLRPHMATSRKNVINEAFHKLDVNGDGEISVDDLRGESNVYTEFGEGNLYTFGGLLRQEFSSLRQVYADNARQHPMYLAGKWTLDQTLRHFLDALDTPGCKDGKVSLVEFFNFYAGVSGTVDDDCYFDLMMRACYNLPPRGHVPTPAS